MEGLELNKKLSETFDRDYLKELTIRCTKCGNCLAVCPVYNVERKEFLATRGKIALAQALLEGNLSFKGDRFSEIYFNCLLCKRCLVNCPSFVKYDEIAFGIRSLLVKERGLPFVKKLIFSSLKNKENLERFLPFAFYFEKIAEKTGLKNLVEEIIFQMPSLSKNPFISKSKERYRPLEVKHRVLFFAGCATNYIFPETGKDTVKVLRRLKTEVIIPKEQACCGMPVLVHGDIETAKELAVRNVQVLRGYLEKEKVDNVITICASCGSALKVEYPLILRGTPYEKIAEELSEKVMDINVFLNKLVEKEELYLSLDSVEAPLRVYYHDPCHLKNSLKVFSEPREVLKKIKGVLLVGEREDGGCCGSGGSYYLTHQKTAQKILKEKMIHINKLSPDLIVTSCPACIMQLKKGEELWGEGRPVMHITSFIYKVLEAKY